MKKRAELVDGYVILPVYCFRPGELHMNNVMVLLLILCLALVCCAGAAPEERTKKSIRSGGYKYIVLDEGTAVKGAHYEPDK